MYIIVAFLILLGSFVNASSGFGFAIITMSLFPLFFGIIDSMILSTVANLMAVVFIVYKYFKYISFKLLIVPLLFSLTANYFALNSITSIDNQVMVRVLGVALILLSVYLYFFNEKVKIPANQLTASLAGLSAGLMGGFFSIPGPPIVLYYSTVIKEKKEYISTIQFFFLINSLFKIIYFVTQHEINRETITLIPLAILTALIGAFIGNKTFDKLSKEKIKKVVYIVMVFAGIKYVLF